MKKTSSEAILKEELQTFNWNEVDIYPSFSVCDKESDEQLKKICFQETLTTTIYSTFSDENIMVTKDINDIINVKFLISETGSISLIDVQMDSITTTEIPNIEDLLRKSLESLPVIYPAIKRGQHVKTQFTIPIQIQVN